MRVEKQLKKYIRFLDSFMNYNDMLEKEDLPAICTELRANLKDFQETLDENNESLSILKLELELLKSSDDFLKNFKIYRFNSAICRLSVISSCFEKAIDKTNQCLIKLNWKINFQ